MTETIELQTRPSIGGPIRVGNYNLGDTIEQWEPEVGNGVTLYSDGVGILATITSAATNAAERSYEAEITGFENYDEYEFKGKKPGDHLKFNYANIFSYWR